MQENNGWHLFCLGALRAERGEARLDRFRTQKTAALLALLALCGPQNRESICALLWPDASPEAARNSLSAALSALRRDLGEEIVVADRQTVSLARGAVETDVAAFDLALKNRDFARAVEIYRGHLLPGFHEDPFPILAGETEEKARGAFTSRLEELETARDADALRSLARRAFALFGDDQRWFLSLMRAHHMAGDLDAALRAYESLGRFARKNGEVAGDEARALAKAIRREKEALAGLAPSSNLSTSAGLEEGASPANETPAVCDQSELSSPPSSSLPQVWTRFFGREAERELLSQWLQNGQKLITLSGAGGSGKTRLALETLRQIAPDWNGATYFVPLAALSEAELLFSGVRDALHLGAAPESAPLEQIERALGGKRAVLLLDNFEQLVAGGAERLQKLRERLPDAAFVVTSRVLLQLPGEREFPVAPLPTPLRNSAPERVKECASVALFCDRASLSVEANNAEAVGALCRRLDGIPLALELAAARAKVLSPAQILERLQKHPDFLQSRELGVPARHKTLRATIEWSTELLSPELREFWTRLSLFHGGWTLEAAEKIAAPGVCEEWETLDFLTQLRECSLVFVEERGDECRFRMLQTLREFGRDALKSDELEQIERARFDFYLVLAQEAASAMQGPAQTTWLHRLDAEQDNLRASLSWARDHDAPRGLQLATALIDFWETRLSLDEGRGWIEEFLRATGPQNGHDSALETRSRALNGAGRLAWYASDMTGASALLEQGLEAARQSGDRSALIYATRTLSRVAAVGGEAEKGRELGRESVRLARETGDESLLLEALMDLGFADFNVGDFEGVERGSQEALSLARRLGDEGAQALALNLLACMWEYQGRLNEALPLIEESEAICRQLGLQWELGVALALQGQIWSKLGDFSRSQAAYNEAISLCRATSLLTWHTITTLLSMSWAWLRRGNARGAATVMGASQSLSESLGYTLMPALVPIQQNAERQARETLGDIAFEAAYRRGQQMTPDQVADFAINPASPDETALGEAALIAARSRALSGAGRLAWHGSDLENARELVHQGLDAARQSDDLRSFVVAVAAFVRFAMVTGDVEGYMAQARVLSEEAVARSEATGEAGLLIESLTSLGYAHTVVGHLDAARGVNTRAIALARELGDETNLARILTLQAAVWYHGGHFAPARALVEESLPICQRLGSTWDLIAAQWTLSHIAREQGDLETARRAAREVGELHRANPSFRWGLANVLLTIAYLQVAQNQPQIAARLMGAAQKLWDDTGYSIVPVQRAEDERYHAKCRAQLGETEFEAAWETGRAMTVEAAMELALAG